MLWVSQGRIGRSGGSGSPSACGVDHVEPRDRLRSAAGHGDAAQRIGQSHALQPVQQRGIRHHQPRIGDAQHMFEDAAAVADVERHLHGAEPIGGEPDQQSFRPVRQPDQDMVALPHALTLQPGGHGGDAVAQRAVGPAGSILEADAVMVRPFPCMPFQQRAEHATVELRHAGVEPVFSQFAGPAWRCTPPARPACRGRLAPSLAILLVG
jgi:hypothetical protein